MNVAIEQAAKRGKTNAALLAIEGQRKARQALTSERQQEASTLADLCRPQSRTRCSERQARQMETDAAPIRYVAELISTDTDSEQAIRWLIALMVLCCDPLAIALMAGPVPPSPARRPRSLACPGAVRRPPAATSADPCTCRLPQRSPRSIGRHELGTRTAPRRKPRRRRS